VVSNVQNGKFGLRINSKFQLLILFRYIALPIQVRSTVISASVCLFVCVCLLV